MKTALLLVDIQNDYFPDGAMALEGSVAAGHAAARLLQRFRDLQWPVIHIQHLTTRPNAAFFLPGTPGAEIHACVQPQAGEDAFQKHYPNSFRNTPLLEHLLSHGIRRLVVAGMMTHMCIDTTVRAATDLGFECVLAHDACATRPLSFHQKIVAAADVQSAFMAALNGPFAQVLSTDETLQFLERLP